MTANHSSPIECLELDGVLWGGATVPVAVFEPHRAAFFYWGAWSRDLGLAPDLVSIDWHTDLCLPFSPEVDDPPEWLATDLSRDRALAHAACCLRVLNDEQILAAAYAGFLADVHVYHRNADASEQEPLIDRHGATHEVLATTDFDSFLAALRVSDGPVYLDVDLDYFQRTGSRYPPYAVDPHRVEPLFGRDSRLAEVLRHRVVGVTIAREARYCGGEANADELQQLVLAALFGDSAATGRRTVVTE